MTILPDDPPWNEITDSESFDGLLGRTSGFHDGFVRMAKWIGGSHVNSDLSAVDRHLGSVWILIQMQNEREPTAELFLSGVRKLSIRSRWDAEPTATFSEEGVRLELLSCCLDAETLSYRLGGKELLGEYPEIPTWILVSE